MCLWMKEFTNVVDKKDFWILTDIVDPHLLQDSVDILPLFILGVQFSYGTIDLFNFSLTYILLGKLKDKVCLILLGAHVRLYQDLYE